MADRMKSGSLLNSRRPSGSILTANLVAMNICVCQVNKHDAVHLYDHEG